MNFSFFVQLFLIDFVFINRTSLCPLCGTRLLLRHIGPLHLQKDDIESNDPENVNAQNENALEDELIGNVEWNDEDNEIINEDDLLNETIDEDNEIDVEANKENLDPNGQIVQSGANSDGNRSICTVRPPSANRNDDSQPSLNTPNIVPGHGNRSTSADVAKSSVQPMVQEKIASVSNRSTSSNIY